MKNGINRTRLAGLAALALLSMGATAGAREGSSGGGGDAWLRAELQNPRFIEPGGFASPDRNEYRPFYGYGYPYTPYVQRRAIIEVRPYGPYVGPGW